MRNDANNERPDDRDEFGILFTDEVDNGEQSGQENGSSFEDAG